MSPTANHRTPLVSIDMHRETIDVTTAAGEQTPDQTWRHTDSNGHLHAWDGDQTPSLEWVITGQRYVGDEYGGDTYDVGEYRCRSCGEAIVPRMKTDHSPKYIPGPTTWTITIGDEQFALNEDEYTQSLDAWLTALRKTRP